MKKNNKSTSSLLLALFLLCISQIAIANEIIKTQKPSWVVPVAIHNLEKIPQNQIQNGIYYSLVDTQVLVNQGQEPIYHYHYANHIVNQTGLENGSQLNLDYDPSYQRLKLHSLRVVRDAKSINKMSSARMKLIQREEDMDDLIYNGRITLNIIIDDVRVGDTIEYSYSIEGMNPIFESIFAYNHSLSWSVPVGKLSLRLLWNKPTSLQYQLKNTPFNLTQSDTARGKEFLLVANSIEPVKREDNTPSWYSPWGAIYFSELKTWEEVAQWGTSLYQDIIIDDKSIQQLVNQIRSQHKGIDEQISAALQFSQDEIRYLGIELGQNSHKPRDASVTLNNRYGDCKDKTVLFIAILKGLGIKGYPALVDTNEVLNPSLLPSIHAFDHVITYVEHNNKYYWLDPTRTHQHGKIDNIHQPDYGHALILRNNTRELTKMSPIQSKHGEVAEDVFNINEEKVIYTTQTQKYGWKAERQRQRLESLGSYELQQEYLEFYQSYFPGIEVDKPIEIIDNSDENKITSNEKYRISNFWIENDDEEKYEADFYPNVVSYLLEIPDETTRNQPLYLIHPINLKQTIKVIFEKQYWYFENEEFVEDNDFFYFNNTVTFDDDNRQLTLVYTYQSKTDHVKSEDYSDYLAALERTNYNQSYGIYKSYTLAETPEENRVDFLSYMSTTVLIIIYGALFLLVIILWRIEQHRKPNQTDTLYFPVSAPKLIAMWVLTFGLYSIYWFYKNFKYIKENEKNSSMPIARGIFNYFWYYSLWKALTKDSNERFARSHLPNIAVAVLFSLMFLALIITNYIDVLIIPSLLAGALLVLPLASYILFINSKDSIATKTHSKWSFRHYVLALLSIPILLIVTFSESGIIPNDAVVKGDRVLSYNIKFMQRQRVLDPEDNLIYFYSGDFLSTKKDGNGFTERHVFSYWKDENNTFHKEKSLFKDIQDIDVVWGTGFDEDTVVTITRKDGSNFLLFLSNTDDKDELFVSTLKEQWLSQY